MKTIAKDNIKKIRKENTKGNFSTLKNSILEDNRLSASARLLLVYVFAKSDDFAYSETNILNFLNVTHKTYYKIREELIQFGYLKINTNVTMKSQNYYIFSEYGNLKSNVEDNSQPESNEPEISKTEQPQEETSVDELCTMEDVVRLGFDLKLETLLIDITNEGYTVDVDKLLDMFFTKVTKKQVEKGFNLAKLKKSIIERFATKIEIPSTKIEKITDKELEEMIITKGNGLTKDEKKSVFIMLKKRMAENPTWTITEISSKILALVADAFTKKTKNLDPKYQN